MVVGLELIVAASLEILLPRGLLAVSSPSNDKVQDVKRRHYRTSYQGSRSNWYV